jgi:hypothetical protein
MAGADMLEVALALAAFWPARSDGLREFAEGRCG